MRQKLNENPVAQIAVVAVLGIAAAIFLLGGVGGGGETSESSSSSSPAGGLEGSTPVAAASAVSAPAARSLPHPVEAAYARGDTVALLIYRPGGIDDRHAAAAAGVLGSMPGVAFFTAPVSEISRYAPITGPLGVNQAPALIVISPRSLNGDAPAPATVSYGFQSASDIRQAVVDAGYRGPELTYAPK